MLVSRLFDSSTAFSCTTTATEILAMANYSRRRCILPCTSFAVIYRCTPHLPSTLTPPSSSSSLHRSHLQQQFRYHHSSSSFHRTSPLYLNRILFDISEIDDVIATPSASGATLSSSDFDNNNHKNDMNVVDDITPLATVTLPRDDYRTIHVAKILGLCNGDTVRAGVVRSAQHQLDNDNCNDSNGDEVVANERRSNHQNLAGLITDDATISWLPEGKNKKAQPTKNGEPPGSLRLSIPQPPKTILYNDHHCGDDEERDGLNGTPAKNSSSTTATSKTTRCPVSLLLALPRPLQLGRLLPMITQLGIHHLILTSAKKVPKDYFGSHILRQPSTLRNLLIEGLAQCGDVQLPQITIVKHSLREFMEEELESLFPLEEVARVVAHPTRIRRSVDGGEDDIVTTTSAMRMSDIQFPNDEKNGPRQLLIAVG